MSSNTVPDTLEEGEKTVHLNGTEVQKCHVPLGKEFVENGRLYQSLANRTTYGKVPFGSRYRHGDEWYYKHPAGPKPLNPNMPFGCPFYRQRERVPHESERVAILEVIDRGSKP